MADLSALRERVRDRGLTIHERAVAAMIERVRDRAPKDSLALANSIVEQSISLGVARFESTLVATAEHARWQDEGTGVHGPSGQRISSPTGKPLTFYWKKAGGVVSFMSVAGTPATRFWSETVTASGWRECVAEAIG